MNYRVPIVLFSALLSACGEAVEVETLGQNVEQAFISEFAGANENDQPFPIHDLSVEFEDIDAAKSRLARVASAINADENGVFYFTTNNDDLSRRSYIFAITPDTKRFVKLVTPFGETTTQYINTVDSMSFDQKLSKMTLRTDNGIIEIGPIDVTSMGG